jgi:hypothetical protein
VISGQIMTDEEESEMSYSGVEEAQSEEFRTESLKPFMLD